MQPLIRVGMLAVAVVLLGACSGGGSSTSDGDGQGNAGARDRAFREQAIELAHEMSTASCTEVQCALPEHADHWYDSINDLEKGACEYACMPVEIDTSGEVRYFLIWIVFERFPDGCFESQGELVILSEVRQLCDPSF